MSQDGDRQIDGEDLRRRAEDALARQGGGEPSRHENLMTLLHDLQVHQIELEMQNEQLQQTRGELERSRDLYARLYDFAPVGYATVDRAGRIYAANLTLITLLGRERQRVLGRYLTNSVAPEHQPPFLLMLQEICTDLVGREVQLSLQTAEGDSRWVLMRGQPIVDPTRDEGECRLSVTDITALRATQQALADLNRSLEQKVSERTALAEGRAADLVRLTADLARVEQQERHRLAQQLHDHVQQLLAAVGMRLDIIRRRHDPETLAAQLQELRQLVAETLEATRDLTVELSPPILRQGNLPEALRWLADWIGKRHLLEVDARIEEEADPGRQDLRVLLFDAARELLFNVRKHAGVDRAELVARRRGDRLELTVIDHGTGLPPGKDLTPPSSGFGLLSIREHMEAAGGEFTLRSLAEGGTEAAIVLPIADIGGTDAVPASVAVAESNAPTRAAASAPRSLGAVAPSGLRSRIGVLLVDDHPIVREGLASMIVGQPDMDVVGQATEGREAVQMSGRLLPDVVIMDVSMPSMGGEQATQLIKELVPGVRIVALSMHEEQAVIDRMRRAGADAFVTKGCRVEDLLRAIRG